MIPVSLAEWSRLAWTALRRIGLVGCENNSQSECRRIAGKKCWKWM